ncbi:MAG: chromosome partitioning protein ParB [Bacteroidetes bacterium GWE2_39_28]|nr:MAG: chromosome partitioning protein ParB [Bacteroidetes bacterium GWE2_39_28]OFY12627.1 MAG: chromosome partitioning protein ParB [Bacteroidetes bacterium GWF2_39_10]HCT94659.1 chromosome partitioning protein ParB [Rikenellaceae bacterium]HCV16046.1 chromosome partitioning protein ParB [Rikenellaceae bacterium]
MKKSALGRGLGALISDIDNLNLNKPLVLPGEATPSSISEIALDQIEANPFQPRSTFDEELLEELAESIKTMGLIQPITVRFTDGGKYQIISGERRFRASLLAGLTHIPAYVRKADDQGMLEMAIVENIQRENLDAIEVAISFQRLIEECDLTQEQMAERVGKKRATVTNYLRLLKLPAEIQLAIRAKRITMGHARALLALDNPKKQLKLCNGIIENDLSVRQVEEKIRKMTEVLEIKPVIEEHTQELDESFFRLLDFLGKYFNNNISLKKEGKEGAGSITIRFSGDEEIINFINAIEKTNL